MNSELKRLDKRTLYNKVGDALREYIIANNLRQGDRLPTETELAQNLGVSRNSIREGIRYLETLGYIETYIKTGMTVKAVNLEPLADMLSFQVRRLNISQADLHEARLMLELDAVELAIARITADQLAELDRSIDRSEQKHGMGDDITDEDYVFHKTLFLAARNKVIGQFSDVLYSIFDEQIKTFARSENKAALIRDNGQTIEEHRGLVAAIRNQDGEAAARLLRRHLSVYDHHEDDGKGTVTEA